MLWFVIYYLFSTWVLDHCFKVVLPDPNEADSIVEWENGSIASIINVCWPLVWLVVGKLFESWTGGSERLIFLSWEAKKPRKLTSSRGGCWNYTRIAAALGRSRETRRRSLLQDMNPFIIQANPLFLARVAAGTDRIRLREKETPLIPEVLNLIKFNGVLVRSREEARNDTPASTRRRQQQQQHLFPRWRKGSNFTSNLDVIIQFNSIQLQPQTLRRGQWQHLKFQSKGLQHHERNFEWSNSLNTLPYLEYLNCRAVQIWFKFHQHHSSGFFNRLADSISVNSVLNALESHVSLWWVKFEY